LEWHWTLTKKQKLRLKKRSGKNFMERIITNFGFHSTADEVADGIDVTGKRVIITGGASGIGKETVRTLAKAGAAITLAVRNTTTGNKVAAEIISGTGNSNIDVARLDLEDIASIDTFVNNWKGPLHILINNAGVMAFQELQKTVTGTEMQFFTNHIGHFALSLGLHGALASAGAARIVVVSSTAHLISPVVFDDINFSFRPYDPWLSYGQSKTANILFAVGATQRWAKDGITANALHPGSILTNLQRNVGGKLGSAPEFHKTTQQGAATSVLLATSPLLEGIGGRYFENCNEAVQVVERPADYHGVAPYALDTGNADRLWALSMGLLGK
jgi:NAD(P)-dependent dehydrogenase (short-subunit alcohol dehydrogenase family)